MATNAYGYEGGPFTDSAGVSDPDSLNWKYSSPKIWHDFDVAGGIDSF